MALPEVTNYDATVYEILITDAVEGYNPANPNNAANVGISNQAALNLANRTNWLYTNLNLVIAGTTIPPTVAPLLSPVFTGTPTTPTAPLGDSSLKLANTAFVQGTLAGVLALSVAGGSNVSLSAVQAGNGILNFSGALTANIATILPNTSGKWIIENNTTGAFSLTVKTAAGTGVSVTQGKSVEVYGDGTNVYLATNDFSNVQLTGVPTAPTPSAGDQSSKVATTNFAYQLKNGVVTVPVGGGSNVTLTPAQYGNGILLLTGALTAAIEVILPAQGGQYVVANETTGAFGLTIGCVGAGATATIPQGQSVIVYCDGTNTVLAGAASSSSFAIHTFTATAAQTTFSCSYTPGNILVIQDGSTLGSANYTATDGANVVLNAGAPMGDEIQVIAFASFTVANAVTTSGATMIGPMNLHGGDTGTTAAQFDNSTKLSTTAFVQSALGNANNATFISGGATTLTPSQVGGYFNIYNAASITLPLSSAVKPGSMLFFWGSSGGANTLQRQGTTDLIYINAGGQSSLSLPAGDTVVLIAQGSGLGWAAVSGSVVLPSSSLFGSSLSSSGFQKLPGGLILQWGQLSTNSSGQATGVLPITFPNNWFGGVASVEQAGSYVATVSSLVSNSITINGYISSSGAAVGAGLAVQYFVFGR